jgi:hypothetical protein
MAAATRRWEGTFIQPRPTGVLQQRNLSDGELYYIIRNGVPLTGMPAWGDPNVGNSDS